MICLKKKVGLMWTYGFNKSIYNWSTTLALTTGLSLKVYEFLLKISFPVEKIHGDFTSATWPCHVLLCLSNCTLAVVRSNFLCTVVCYFHVSLHSHFTSQSFHSQYRNSNNAVIGCTREQGWSMIAICVYTDQYTIS